MRMFIDHFMMLYVHQSKNTEQTIPPLQFWKNLLSAMCGANTNTLQKHELSDTVVAGNGHNLLWGRLQLPPSHSLNKQWNDTRMQYLLAIDEQLSIALVTFNLYPSHCLPSNTHFLQLLTYWFWGSTAYTPRSFTFYFCKSTLLIQIYQLIWIQHENCLLLS